MWHKIPQVSHVRRQADGSRVEGMVGGLRLPFRHNGTSCMSGEPSHGPQTTLQGKAGHLVTVMYDWEQLHINTTLLKSAKHCHNLFRDLQGHKKAIWKNIHGYSVVVSG